MTRRSDCGKIVGMKRIVVILIASIVGLGLNGIGESVTIAEGSTAWSNPGFSSRGIPLNGQTLFGAAVWDEPEAFEAKVGGKLGVRRSYYSPSQVKSAVSRAAADLSAGRLPWIVFKPPYSWKDMAKGRGDGWARDLANRMGALNGPVWLAIHHEPEGKGPASDWRAMQQRVAPILRAKSNIAFSIILMGWYQFFSGKSEYSMEAYWPGKEYVDIAGFDPYNWYGTTSKSGKKKYTWDELDWYYEAITDWLAKTGNQSVKWAVAETGYTDKAASLKQNFLAPSGKRVSTRGSGADWLTRAYDDMKKRGGIALSYFNVSPSVLGESSTWSWPIGANPKIGVYSKILARSDRITDAAPAPTGQVQYRASKTSYANAASTKIQIPDSVAKGDALLMYASINTTATIKSVPSGWKQVGEKTSGSTRTYLFTKTASSTDARKSVSVDFSLTTKTALTVAAYEGASVTQPVSDVAVSAESKRQTSHLAPNLKSTPAGGVVVSYWADKSSASTYWTTPSGTSKRAAVTGSGSGRVTSVLADTSVSGTAPWVGKSATASSASRKATMWSVSLTP